MNYKLIMALSMSIFLATGLYYAESAEKKKYTPEYLKEVHKTFEEFGCTRCHSTSGGEITFTKDGNEAMGKGLGCVGLQTIIVAAGKKKMDGPGIQNAKKAFEFQRCNECHDINGKGEQRQNLTHLGLQMDKKHLGCVNMLTALMAEKAAKK